MCVYGVSRSRKAAYHQVFGLSAGPQPQLSDWPDLESCCTYERLVKSAALLHTRACDQGATQDFQLILIGRCQSLRPRDWSIPKSGCLGRPGDGRAVGLTPPPPCCYSTRIRELAPQQYRRQDAPSAP
jgi:hypothetical protein